MPPVSREDLVLAALAEFAENRGQLETFLDVTGQDRDGLRAALADGSLQSGLLDHLLGHEDLLRAVAARLSRRPELVAEALIRLRS